MTESAKPANERSGVIYEVTLVIDADVADGLDDWLTAHVAKLLEQPGFAGAEIDEVDTDDGRESRVVRYHVADRAALDAYLDGPATALRAETAAQFGEHFTASRRILTPAHNAAVPHCLNCDTELTGQYCGQCGQRAQGRLISVWELLRDAFGDLVDADSRIWQTLRQLAFRPGQLTSEYLSGRRARYMPPFRTYLVLSLVFFAVAFFDPREELSILFEAPTEAVEEARPGVEGNSSAAEGAAAEAPASESTEDAAAAASERLADKTATSAGVPPEPPSEDNPGGVTVSIDGNPIGADCDLGDYNPADLPPWLGKRLTRDRLQATCERMTASDGSGLRGFAERLVEFIPVGLFVLLPFTALVLKVLYPLSRRFYVEHLLLVIHFHSFAFLALTLQVLLSRLFDATGPGDAVEVLGLAVLPVYMPVYLYKSLRRVYRQGHLATSLKFTLLALAYAFGLALILAVAALIAAFAE